MKEYRKEMKEKEWFVNEKKENGYCIYTQERGLTANLKLTKGG